MPEPRPAHRLAAGEGVDALAQRGVGGTGEVEPLADPVRVEGEEPARAVDERARRTNPEASGAVCSRLPPIRLPPGPRNVCSMADTVPAVTRAAPAPVAARPKTTSPMAASASDQASGRRPGRVDLDDREVAVRIDAADRAALRSAVAERDGDLVAAEVVGVGEDAAVGDDDAAAAVALADADDGRAGRLVDAADRAGKIVEDGHVVRVSGCGATGPAASSPLVSVVSCKSQHTTHSSASASPALGWPA